MDFSVDSLDDLIAEAVNASMDASKSEVIVVTHTETTVVVVERLGEAVSITMQQDASYEMTVAAVAP